jgi:hypothetical protein
MIWELTTYALMGLMALGLLAFLVGFSLSALTMTEEQENHDTDMGTAKSDEARRS